MRRGFPIAILLSLPLLLAAQSVTQLFLPEGASVFGNPASMVYDEAQNYTFVGPSLSTVSGGLKRLYDPGSFHTYDLSVQTVRVLGSKGTFRGSASYSYQQRQDVWSSLRINPYLGDGFVAVDTMPGNTRYSGPDVRFEYAYQLWPELSIGLLGDYRVLDGLKDAFTNASTAFRSIRYGFGAQYQTPTGDRGGLTLIGVDEQEKIESKSSDDLKDVEVFSYRGETYATRRRSSTTSEVFRTKGIESALDVRYRLSSAWDCTAKLDLAFLGFKSLFPSGLMLEVEDGYAQQVSYGGELMLGWHLSDEYMLRVGFSVRHRDSWSRISSRQLLFWEWNVDQAEGAVELLQKLNESAQLRLAAMIGSWSADSNKYIDARSRSVQYGRYGGAFGYQSKITEHWSIDFRAIVRISQFDPFLGGEELRIVDLTGVLSYDVTPTLNVALTCFGGSVSGKLLQASESRLRRGFSVGVKIIQP